MIYFFTVYLIFLYLVSLYILNNKKLINKNLLEHQIFINRSVPLVGGIFLLFPVFFFFSFLNKFTLFIYFNLFLLGTLSDFNYLSSAKKRFLIQIGIVVFFVFMSKLEVTPTRIEVIDNLFKNSIVSYTFTAFCLLILINGSNFIDGLNGLLLSYFTLILIFLLKLDLVEILVQDNFKIILFLILCIFLLLLNFSNKIFMGDNGAYSIGFLFGVILIKIYNIN